MRVALLTCVLGLTACAREPDPPTPTPSTPTPRVAPRPAIGLTLLAVRPGAKDVEVEVALDRVVPPLESMRPVLRIGAEVSTRSLAGTGGRLDRRVFLFSPEQRSRMADDDELVVELGPLTNAAASRRPRLGDVAPTPTGGEP